MPGNAVLSRVNKVDLFAVLGPGFYIFFSFYLLSSAFGKNSNLWESVKPLITLVQATPSYFALILFVVILIGTIIRSLPVDLADHLFKRSENFFPYRKEIIKLIETLNAQYFFHGDSVTFHKISQLSQNELLRVFNYWKDRIVINEPSAFDYYLSFEARSRFFAGMFWSGIVGLLISIGLFIVYKQADQLPIYEQLYAQHFAISLILILSFGFKQLHRVRRGEVHVLITLYLSFLKKELKPVQKRCW